MLETAAKEHSGKNFTCLQGDAVNLPLEDGAFDTVVMLGGIHLVTDRDALFSEVFRVLRKGGMFYWREPVSDFFVCRWIRSIIYAISPALDADTERPLLWKETVPNLEQAGIKLNTWKTFGAIGFCLFMNSDVLVFNRLFRFIPGIRAITRLFTKIDDFTTKVPPLKHAGLIVVGAARKQ
jgi:ubiquinone/menaquinone biosynthesis C-methylase UbiE